MTAHATKTSLSLSKIYQNLYPWNSLDEFVQQLKSTIAYRSPDNSLIALNKPFGVGSYKVLDPNQTKQNPDRLLTDLTGSPKYCLTDALDSLAKSFNSPNKYFIIKGIDRYTSGLTLIANDKKHADNFARSVRACRATMTPLYGFRAITVGYPKTGMKPIIEKVGMQQIEVDELGDYKEPIIQSNPGSTFHKRKDKKIFRVEMNVKSINQKISTALVEIFVSNNSWDFPRCYISSKTAFILGDVRFGRRIREVLGKRVQVSAFKSSGLYDDSYEPLNEVLISTLRVQKNNKIPMMLDHHCLRLKYFDKKTKEDLIISSPYTPLHFAATAECLQLNKVEPESGLENEFAQSSQV